MARNNVFGFYSNTNYTNILSSIVTTLENFIKSQLPDDYIKTTLIENSNITFSRKDRPESESHHILKPSLQIKPSYKFEETDSSIRQLSLHSPFRKQIVNNINHYYVLYGNSNRLHSIRYELHRIKTTFGIEMIVESPLQMLNVANFLRETINPNNYYFLNNQNVVVEIPRNIIDILAWDMEVDLNDKVELRQFIDDLNTFSKHTIDYRINAHNGNKTVSFFHNTNLLVKVSEIDSEVNMVEKSPDRCKITFNVEVELSYPTYYVVTLSKQPEPTVFNEGLTVEGDVITYSKLIDTHRKDVYDDKSLVFYQKFITDRNVVIDQLLLKDLLEDNLINYIDSNLANTSVLDTNILIKIFDSNDRELISGIGNDYVFNWETKMLTLLHPKPNINHIVAMYINLNYLKPYDNSITGLDLVNSFDVI